MLAFIRQAWRQSAREWRRLGAIRDLSKLNDRLLADIGLCREQLRELEFETPSEEAKLLLPNPGYRPELMPCG